MQIGFLGLGHMGHGMAAQLVAAGHSVDVMAHRKRDAVDDMTSRGAREVDSIAQMAKRSDVILLCVPDAEAVNALLRSADGIGTNSRSGTIIVDCTTSRPDTLRALARDFPDLHFLDAPLGRSPAEAWKGKLSIMVGGEREIIERVRPLFECVADDIQVIGPLGAGHTLKLVNNFVSMGYAALYSEAIVLASAAGLTPADFDRVIGASRMTCPFFETFMGWIRTGDATTHRFALDEAHRTVSDISELARDLGLDTRLADAIVADFRASVEAGYGRANLPELPRAVAEREDVPLTPITGR